ncbi:uncharacterized protein LOC119630214 isoform X1 [Bombyx mori]|uniref:uncharacterized protein LOC119630214 isoform X1 n=1 Tax=Bombyx mori TaxID=7091 RepID=UPI002ED48784
MSQHSEDLDTLIKRRGAIKAKLTIFRNYIKPLTSFSSLTDLQRFELEGRYERIQCLYNDFDKLQTEIETLLDAPDDDFKSRCEFEDQYHPAVALARSLLSATTNSEDSGRVHTNVRLPKIDLPHFDGSVQGWLEFKDTYISLIHNNKCNDDIMRFHYLRSCLRGSAALVIKNIDFTSENYNNAWDLLCQRYDKDQLLIHNHVQALFSVAPCSKESSKSLRYLIDVTNKNIRALKTLKQPTEHWDTLIIFMISQKLDSSTSRYWEEHRNKLSEPPTLNQFIFFIENQINLLEKIEENSKINLKSKETNNNNYNNKSTNYIIQSNSNQIQSNHSKCPLCNENHLLYTCKTFRSLPTEVRIEKAKNLKVCMNCLRLGHTDRTCKLSHCKYCKARHNTLLHSEPERSAASNPMPGADNVAFSANFEHSNTASFILLSTAMVRVRGADGTKHPARVLLDNVKAVHIELVTALSSEAYIAALKRFVSRRGKPRSIWSDNGTNFVGACNELKGVLSNSDIASFMSQEGIDFSFSPPYSPHFNGLAEAAVKATKGHLKKLLSLTHLTYEEMSSCLCQIEAILNSRPLTPISSVRPLDLTALTPAHFLIGRPLTSVPHPQITDGNITRLERYQRVELIRQHFWKRFINEYISLLQQKSKWSTSTGSLIPGTLVLVKDRTLPALLWPLGRITKTYPGSDGITRVAEVKTRTGTVVRGFNSICPLPLH